MIPNTINKIVLNIRPIFCLLFFIIMIITPLTLPNWWIFSDIYHEINSSEWKNYNCKPRFDQQFVNLDHVFPNSTGGGRYYNNNCSSAKYTAIIVPYRNRSEYLQLFLNHIHHFLLTQNSIHYQIYVVEQLDDSPFNRGLLLNIGYKWASIENSKISCFIFHDVDILPTNIQQHYTCSSYPRHLCSYIDKLRYVLLYQGIFGGVIAIQKEQFKHVNGFSNAYSGWGGEDDDFFQRVITHFTLIERYNKTIGSCKMMKHSHNIIESNNRKELLRNCLKRMHSDGLNKLDQVYLHINTKRNRLFTKISIKLKKK